MAFKKIDMIGSKSIDRYYVNENGLIFDIKKEHLCRQVKNSQRYVVFKRRGDKNMFVHRLVGKYFIPNPENKAEINHKNGCRYDNRLENLEWVTRQENMLHAYKTGLWDPYVGVPSCKAYNLKMRKLTMQQASEIRKKYVPFKYTIKKLAKEYKVSGRAICFILSNECYKNSKLPERVKWHGSVSPKVASLIRKKYKPYKYDTYMLAEEFKLSQSVVYNVVMNKTCPDTSYIPPKVYRGIPPFEVKNVIAAYKSGKKSLQDLAIEYNVTVQAINYHVKKKGHVKCQK